MPSQPNGRSGFTIIEMLVAVVILIVLMALTVPSMSGVMADRRLRKSLDEFNAIVREAQERSVVERRSYLIVWQNAKLGLRAEALQKGESAEPTVKWRLARDESLTIEFPAALVERPPAEWIFWASGNCEPAVVTYRGKDGTWKASYSPLTGRPVMLAYVAK